MVTADDEAPNIVGCVEAGAGGRHVVFNAHMDTMEAGDEAAWTVPITRLSRRDGRLYGLGMGNIKGALAAMCLATAILKRHSNAWKGRLTLTAVSDEVMFGERGAVFLLRERPDVAGDFLISGEGPGFMHFAVAEKGLLWLDAEARSGGGHASRALRGDTAVMKLAAFLARIDAMNEMYATLPRELTGVSGGEGNLGLRLSLNAGTLAAGTVRSQVAPRARASRPSGGARAGPSPPPPAPKARPTARGQCQRAAGRQRVARDAHVGPVAPHEGPAQRAELEQRHGHEGERQQLDGQAVARLREEERVGRREGEPGRHTATGGPAAAHGGEHEAPERE